MRIPRLRVLLSLALCLCASLSFAEPDAVPYLSAPLGELAAEVPIRTVVALGTFTYADKKVGSPFSRYLEDALSFAIAQDGRMDLFARDQLDAVLSAQELNLSDLVDEKAAVPSGRLKGVQALLSGSFYDTGPGVEVHLELVSVESATVIGRATATVPKSAIPATVSILPDNYSDALYVLDQLASVQGTGNGSFQIRAWNVRGDGGTYRDGERLVVSFFSSRDCFVKVYHVDVLGRTQLIFPNQFYGSNTIVAGRVYRIPDATYPFSFDLGPPYGTEFIKVVASTVQFTDIEQAFADMGKVSRSVVTRGLVVAGKDSQVAEASFSYTILR